jgi:hypothetical protein
LGAVPTRVVVGLVVKDPRPKATGGKLVHHEVRGRFHPGAEGLVAAHALRRRLLWRLLPTPPKQVTQTGQATDSRAILIRKEKCALFWNRAFV